MTFAPTFHLTTESSLKKKLAVHQKLIEEHGPDLGVLLEDPGASRGEVFGRTHVFQATGPKPWVEARP